MQFYIASHEIFRDVEQLRRNLRTRTSQLPTSYQLTSNEKAQLADKAKDYTILLLRYLELAEKEDSKALDAEIIRSRSRIFDLCERICFSSNETIAVREVREWLNFHWPLSGEVFEIDSEDEELVLVEYTDLNNRPDDDDHNNTEDIEKTKEITIHWPLIQRQLLRGNIQRVVKLLEICLVKPMASSTQECLRRLIALIKSKPDLPITPSSTLDSQKQMTVWAQWTRKRDLARDAFKSMEVENGDTEFKEIKELFDIVCGDTGTIANASRGSILERFVGLLVFCEPTRTTRESGTVCDILLQAVQEQEERPESTDSVTAACFYLLMRDWDNALSSYDDFWLQTHLGHLLTTATLLEDDITIPGDEQDYEQCTTPVQFIIHIYAQEIANQHDMWLEAVDYIASCTTNREYWAVQLLRKKITMADKDALINMLELCKKQKLQNPSLLLCEALADKYDSRGDVQNAIKYYAKARDISSLDRIADRVLLEYLNDKSIGVVVDFIPTEEDVLEQAQKSKPFAFLVQYTRFKHLLGEHRYAEATQAVKALQESLNAPEGFKIKLLQDIIPILDASSETVFFNSHDTLEMIKHLQRVEGTDASTFMDLRQKLSLNLAHAFLVVS
ncbi:nucleoporin Nup85-like protein [Dichotomocladium elegans]|nr:nucleoporin Nup85-like protein [Dichotomocladium elegans]